MVAWTLEDGLKLIRAIQPKVKDFGYHLALGGGVLNNGVSQKDLDLYFHPLEGNDKYRPNAEALVAWLSEMWGHPDPIGASGMERPQSFRIMHVDEEARFETMHFKPMPLKSSYKFKLKFIRPAGGDRIDVFIV